MRETRFEMMKDLQLLNFVKGRPYLIEVFTGKSAKWITPFINFKIGGKKPFLAIIWRISCLRKNFLQIDWECRERVLENIWIYKCLSSLPDKAKILDIGSSGSSLPFELASMGYQVIGIDLRGYPLEHPNLQFITGNIFYMPFSSDSFDFISAISTIEHLGIPTWSSVPVSSKEDKEGIDEVYRCLKPGGYLYLTVPFGVRSITWQRIYDYKSLKNLLQVFNIILSKYYKRIEKKYWIEVEKKELEKIPSTIKDGVNGVAIILCKK